MLEFADIADILITAAARSLVDGGQTLHLQYPDLHPDRTIKPLSRTHL